LFSSFDVRGSVTGSQRNRKRYWDGCRKQLAKGKLNAIFSLANAGIAQLVEQLICNQQVVGSNPSAGWSAMPANFKLTFARFGRYKSLVLQTENLNKGVLCERLV
jgi:hypothetical protein